MTSLKEKHLHAIHTQSFYTSSLEQIFDKLMQHESRSGSSVWHTAQIKDTVYAKAKELDAMSLEQRSQKPLFGLSIGAKDLFCITGMKTTAGSKILEDFVAPYTSTVISQIESQGGLITGKTAMDEFAMGSFTNTSYLGKTVIPGYEDYTPGGSSGGSAAALFSDLFDLTIGSDTGGSVRQPTAFCGLVGYKPSYGAFSRYGMISYASSLDQAGFMTKTVEDLDYFISSIDTFADSKDKTCSGISKDFQSKKTDELTFGFFEEFLSSPDIEESIRKQYSEKLEKLKSIGVKLKPIQIDLMQYAAQIYYIIACAEASSNLARYQGVYFGKSLTEFISKSGHTSSDYWGLVAGYRSEFFGKEVQKRILLGSHVLSSEKFDAIYKKATMLRKDLSTQIADVLESVDYLILPTFPTQTPQWSAIEKMTTAQIYLADYMTISFSLAGLPVVTVPSTEDFDIKKTTGFQIVGKKFKDYQLIKDALLIEKALKSEA
jgi:aspartyl-tRNA(Asn)/glutamyl-tRNA(Gln) amidotransferase subunit A